MDLSVKLINIINGKADLLLKSITESNLENKVRRTINIELKWIIVGIIIIAAIIFFIIISSHNKKKKHFWKKSKVHFGK